MYGVPQTLRVSRELICLAGAYIHTHKTQYMNTLYFTKLNTKKQPYLQMNGIYGQSISLTDETGHERILPGKYRIQIGEIDNMIESELIVTGNPLSLFNYQKLKANYY